MFLKVQLLKTKLNPTQSLILPFIRLNLIVKVEAKRPPPRSSRGPERLNKRQKT